MLQQQMRSLPQMAQLEPQRAASSVVAAALALALSAANPMMTHASIEQPAVVRCSSGHRDVVLGLMLSIPGVLDESGRVRLAGAAVWRLHDRR